MTDAADASAADLVAQLRGDVAALDRSSPRSRCWSGQARAEAARHEQKRAQAADKLAAPGRKADAAELAEAYGQLVTLTRRAVLMESQVDVLEGKRRALARHRARRSPRHRGACRAMMPVPAPAPPGGVRTPGQGRWWPGAAVAVVSRVVLSAQEDLRREIARAMHDGPAQSLTNIVLQAQIVDRLLEPRSRAWRAGELRLLVSMVQQTLDATKNFIFDVRPMVLDDLGLVPTLRRATRDRGRRAHIPVEFESLGQDRRLPMDVESAVFRILDEALAAYLVLAPERVALRLDWADELEARLSAHRDAASCPRTSRCREMPAGDVPDAIRQMIQDRHDARFAAVAAAEQAAIVALPAAARRDVGERAASIGATVEILAGGGELRLVVPLPPRRSAGSGA